MLDPFTPLGADAFHLLMTGMGRLFGMDATPDSETALIEAGGRLFLNLTSLFRSRFGRSFLGIYAQALDPGCGGAMARLLDDPRFSSPRKRIRARTLAGFLRIARWAAPTVAYNMMRPERGRARLQAALREFAARVEARYAAAGSLGERLGILTDVLSTLPPLFFKRLVPCVASGQIPLQALERMTANLPDGRLALMELTRGLEHNVTTEMDLALWGVSREIAADPAAARRLQSAPADELARGFRDATLPEGLQAPVARFLAAYGARGVAEIDMGRPRWREDPTPLFQALLSYSGISDDSRSPVAAFERGRASARAAAADLARRLRQAPAGAARARAAGFMIRRVRELGGMREAPKLAAVRAMSAGREALLASGRDLVRDGIVERPDDVFFLRLRELEQIAAGGAESRAELVARRRADHERESRRRLVPRVLLSDGTAFFEGVAPDPGADDGRTLHGSPVSPGAAEGTVRVVLDPFTTRVEPGEILVCPATDPAWTPLFLPAAGLVMEVGGMMTHGSVVAREYGIPAVVGVSGATTRLATGDRVRVDGSTGVIRMLEPPRAR
jgi:rifampicin phosphotransferase